ncbi:MAG: trigger factor [Oscillospiraceae bacterium]|jgi:trigger factor|nr:trigger factor [Oscillospiraceae bacterium]
MKLLSLKEKGVSRCEFVVLVEPEEFRLEICKVIQKSLRNFSVPGFRKGKAPRKFVEKHYGTEVFFNDAMNAILPDVFEFLEKKSGKNILRSDRTMEVQAVSANEQDGAELKVESNVLPVIELNGRHKGIKFNVAKKEVTDEEIGEEIVKLLQRYPRYEVVERPAKEGDRVKVSYSVFSDGEEIEDVKAENRSVELGTGRLFPELEAAILGLSAGETAEVPVTFPESFRDNRLAGKSVIFKGRCIQVEEKLARELDDDFAKLLGKENVGELQQALREALEKRNDREFANEKNRQVMSRLVDLVPDDVISQSRPLVDERGEQLTADAIAQIKRFGFEMEEYLELSGQTKEDFKKSIYKDASNEVKASIALNSVASEENISVSDEEVKNKYKEISEGYDIPIDEVKSVITSKQLYDDIKFEKAFKVVFDAAKYDVPVEEIQIDAEN